MIAFRLRVENSSPAQTIHSIALHTQIQIETPAPRYSADEQERLLDLFGEPGRWGQTLRPMLWTHADVTVPAFSDSVAVDLRVPCSFDFNLAATKYFYGLADGDIPLIFLFSGSCFYAGAAGGLEVAPIPWSKETRFRLPAACVARNDGPVLSRTPLGCGFARMCSTGFINTRCEAGIATWEEALESLLEPVNA